MHSSISNTLQNVNNGSLNAYKQLFSLTYSELLMIAERIMRFEKNSHSYSGSDLLHEVFIKMSDKNRIHWKNREHFFGVMAICMHQLLIDYARSENAIKRGKNFSRTKFNEELIPSKSEQREKKDRDLDAAFQRLKKVDHRMARVVECRYFKGFTIEETAHELGVSRNTVNRDWAKARGILYKELNA